MRNRSFIPFLIIGLLSIVGGGMVLYATRGGIGAQSDSAFYISVARNLAAGKGLGLTRPFTGFEFFTLFPPLYSLCLAGLASTGLDLIAAARWMNVILFSLTIAMAGTFFVWKWKSPFAGCLVTALIAFSPSMLAAHAWLLSEPLYYFFATLSLLSLIGFLGEQRWAWLVVSAAAAALAALDRYAGLALAMGGLIILLLDFSKRLITRMKYMGVFALISLVPTGIWLWVVRVQSATLAGRELFAPEKVLPRLGKLIGPLKQTVIGWMPFSAGLPFVSDPDHYKPFWIITILLLMALVVAVILLIRRGLRTGKAITNQVDMLKVFIAFMLCHVLIFVGASLFLTASPATGDRNFAPLLFACYFLLSASFVLLLRTLQGKTGLIRSVYVLAGLLIAINTAQGLTRVAAYPGGGLGYNTRSARQSPIFNAIRNLPEDLLIVCNDPNIVLFQTGRGAYPIIELYTLSPEWDFPVYGQGRNRTDQGQLAFEQGQAALVLLPDAYWEFQVVYGDKTDLRMAGLVRGLYVYYDGFDGAIYLKDGSVIK